MPLKLIWSYLAPCSCVCQRNLRRCSDNATYGSDASGVSLARNSTSSSQIPLPGTFVYLVIFLFYVVTCRSGTWISLSPRPRLTALPPVYSRCWIFPYRLDGAQSGAENKHWKRHDVRGCELTMRLRPSDRKVILLVLRIHLKHLQNRYFDYLSKLIIAFWIN